MTIVVVVVMVAAIVVVVVIRHPRSVAFHGQGALELIHDAGVPLILIVVVTAPTIGRSGRRSLEIFSKHDAIVTGTVTAHGLEHHYHRLSSIVAAAALAVVVVALCGCGCATLQQLLS